MNIGAVAKKVNHLVEYYLLSQLSVDQGSGGAPVADLAKQIPWSAVVGLGLTRFIGACEFLGAIGLILPAATRIRPELTALAGALLAIVMTLASGYHVWRGEFQAVPITATLACLAAFVAWGRFRKAPILPRG